MGDTGLGLAGGRETEMEINRVILCIYVMRSCVVVAFYLS